MMFQILCLVTISQMSFCVSIAVKFHFEIKIFFLCHLRRGSKKGNICVNLFLDISFASFLSFSKTKHSCLGTIIVPTTRVSFICFIKRYYNNFLRKFLRISYEAVPFSFFHIFLFLNSFESL